MASVLRDNWKHLRVPFQLTLAPLFLWGALLSGAAPTERLALGFFVFHFLLYTGITAYNSCCDRDQDAIGGLEVPPEVRPSLLPIALLLKAVGMALAVLCGEEFLAIYLVFVVLSILYSHPGSRWKSSPYLSTLVVFGGQGVLGFYAGWTAASDSLAGWNSNVGALGALSAGFTTVGMYPLTQIYQIDDDALRGDETLCVVLGPAMAIRFAQASFLAAGVCAAALCWKAFGWLDAVLIFAAYGAIVFGLERFRTGFERMDRKALFRTVMWILYGCSAAFTTFILVQFVRQLAG